MVISKLVNYPLGFTVLYINQLCSLFGNLLALVISSYQLFALRISTSSFACTKVVAFLHIWGLEYFILIILYYYYLNIF